jgi:hypothetical protein
MPGGLRHSGGDDADSQTREETGNAMFARVWNAGQRMATIYKSAIALARVQKLSLLRFTESANTMAVTSTKSCEPRAHLHEGAIYSDSSNNIIRLLSIRGDYCVYVYVVLGNPRSQMHGSVTGLTRRNVFEAGFTFVAKCAEGWEGSRHQS